MTPAELKSRREALGLTHEFLARRWGMRKNTIYRWEAGRAVPDTCAADLDRLDALAAKAVEAGVAEWTRHPHVIRVPRTDAESPDDMPAMWHRAIGERIRRRTGAVLEWTDFNDFKEEK